MPAAFAAEAGLPVPAEGRGRVEAVERVRPHHARAHALRGPERLGALLGPDPGRQPVGGVVRLRHGLVRGAEREHREHGAEDLLPGHPHRLLDAGEHRRREEQAALGQRARAGPTPGALGVAGRGEVDDPVQLGAGVDRADVGVLVQRVAHAQRLDARRAAAPRTPRRSTPARASRDPAQQTWPWLKKIPSTTPSTAWSSGASS